MTNLFGEEDVVSEQLKRCSKCRQRKTHDCFHKNASMKDGLNRQCIECRKKVTKKLCRECGKEFSVLRVGEPGRSSCYCSDACKSVGASRRQLERDKRNKGRKKTYHGVRTCQICGEVFVVENHRTRARYCKKCSSDCNRVTERHGGTQWSKTRSDIYSLEPSFIMKIHETMLENGLDSKSEYYTKLDTKRYVDVFAESCGVKLVIECKVDRRTTTADQCLGQALIKASQLKAVPICAFPSDAMPSDGFIGIAKGLGAVVVNEINIVEIIGRIVNELRTNDQ